MYIPKNLEINDPEVIKQVLAENGFGVLVTSDLTATHLPLIYKDEDGKLGSILGHFAKSNPHWEAAINQRVLIVFQGPHAYISPNWYATKPAVPTWNYVAVHCYGYLELLSNDENKLAMDQLVNKYEPGLSNNLDIMPNEYQERLRNGVVGFKVVLDDIHAKEKLGQQRKPEDQAGVYAGLSTSCDTDSQKLSAYMLKRSIGVGI